jgi:hypothetical protein
VLPICNRAKGEQTEAADPETGQVVPLFSPQTQAWFEHFCGAPDGLRILGLSPTGRATVTALHLSDEPDVLEVRRWWVLAGCHPPPD